MGLFSSECKHCGSKEHTSNNCPHGIFSSKCKHCGSIEHSSKDCPHGLFSSKCKHCGSTDHSSDDCPHGIFSSECKHCGSKEHSSNDCPHGIFSSKCKHCGSTEHASNDCPHGFFSTKKQSSNNYSLPKDEASMIFSLIKWGVILAIAAFVITVAIFLGPIILLIWYLIKKREIQWIGILGIVMSAYLSFDISTGGFITNRLMHMKQTGEEKYIALGYFAISVITLGFFLEKYTSKKIPVIENGNFFQKKNIKQRRPLIAGLSVLLLAIFSITQFVNFSSYKQNQSGNNETNSTITTQKSSTNSINNTNLEKGSELAIISDSDGFTNLRQGKGTNYSVVKKIYNNEKFYVFPTSEKWWKVKLNNGTEGYIYHNRVDLLNKEFYIINVTATKTESKALTEVKKLQNQGYKAGHLWIPNYNSLSGSKYYSVYIGPFESQNECEKEVEKYRKINNNAYGTLVSQNNTRVEIKGIGKVKKTINSSDYSNQISDLLIAEETRDFNQIKYYYSNNIQRYWNKYNIGYPELLNQYQKSWKITSNTKNKIQSIKKINNNTYLLNTVFEFYHLKQKKRKSVNSFVRFEFDNYGKIIKVYGNN